MEKKDYFQRMDETCEIVRPIIERYLEPFKKNGGDLYSLISMLPLGTKNSIRTYFLRSAYEAISDRDWKDIAPIGAAIEFELASMYYTNLVFDEKGGKRTREEDKQLVIGGMITRDLANRCLHNLRKGSPPETLEDVRAIKEESLCLFNDTDINCYSGQYLDVVENLFGNINNFKTEESLIELSKRRLYGMNSVFYENIGRIASKLANGTVEQENALAEFGKNFGFAQQIMDDVADFVPERDGQSTVTKIPADAHSDFKHGKLTLPIIYCLYHSENGDREKFIDLFERRNELKENELIDVTKILLRTGSIDHARKEAKGYAKKAKDALKIFPKERRKYLSDMCVIFDSNRYYKNLENYRG